MSLTVQSFLTYSAAHRHLSTASLWYLPFLLPRLTHLTQTFPSCRVYSTKCTVQSVQYRVYSVQYREYSTECTVQSLQYRVYSTEYTIRSVQHRVYSTECTQLCVQYRVFSTECPEIFRYYQLWDTDQSYRMRGPQKIYLSQSTSQSRVYWTSTDTCDSLHYHQSQHQSSNINHQTSNIEDKKFPRRCNRELNSI